MTTLPGLVTPGSPEDYFVREQVALWGDGPLLDELPDHRIAYYRARSLPLGNRRQLFEFIIPMFPHTWLDTKRLTHYENEIAQGVRPTAFVVSILDIKGPVDWEGNPSVTEHWCLAHYLLDGHHKTNTAAKMGMPLDVLSFILLEESLASIEEIEEALTVLAKDSNVQIALRSSHETAGRLVCSPIAGG